MILVDTNIFLEFLLGQKHADECGELLGRLSRGTTEGVVTRFSLHSIEVACDPGPLQVFLSNVERSLGLTVYDTDTPEEEEVARLGKKIGRNFDDSIQYYVATKLGVEAIVSYDKHFDGLGITRNEPGALLRQ